VLRYVVKHDKNIVTVTMVTCMVFFAAMQLFQGLLLWILQIPGVNVKSFLIMYKFSTCGASIIMSCDFLVATLYLKNAVSLFTEEQFNRLTKICIFIYVSLTITVVVSMIIDFISTCRHITNY